jgi:3-oxoacyl-[acyl-carrier protein] reductase
MALYLAQAGANLALVDVNQDRLQETRSECEAAGADCRTYLCNVANEQEVEATFQTIKSDFGELSALVNNAGILRDGMLIKVKDGELQDKMSLAAWQSVIDVNLTGVFLCGREAATLMALQGHGCIINISSVSRAGNMGQTNYSAAKAGVAAMTVTWAKELARHNVRSMAIASGVIKTAMTDSMKPEALEKFCKQVPLGRIGLPEEIAKTVKFILENDYLSGRVIEVDGGLRV